MMDVVSSFLIVYLSVIVSLTNGIPTEYNVGIGIADITGPAAEVNMMGYANPAQTSRGLHLRQFSRTFIFEDQMKNKVVYINLDACMFSQGLKLEIVRQLKNKYGDAYTERNVLITGTHTHSTPGGFHQYLLYDITSLGFVRETFDSLVEGILRSVDRAHDNMKPANIYVNTGELLESNINRSPSAYLKNPPEERAKYKYNVDKNMTVIKIVDADNFPIGMISWFAVHCTSMNNTNRLISSDNKGLAALMLEADRNGQTVLPGKGAFVAAFAQSNEGDVSPNTKGPHCLDTGLPCDFNHSTCNGKNELCVAFGPGNDMFESTEIIARRQYIQAKKLFDTASTLVQGPVDFRHTYTDMSKQTVGEGKKTCKPAMGYSFAAGTTDGPGAFDFTQGSNSSSPFWNAVSGFIKKPSEEQNKCHAPKPILLDTGEIEFPYAWEPSIVDTQIFRVGQLFLIAVPAEFTTMSGRRTRDAVAKTLKDNGFKGEPVPIVAGLSNDYADYVTTFEEYQEQRYEGGSTIYGPHTLEAYINVYMNLSKAMTTGSPVTPGPNPPDLMSEQLSFLPPVVFDAAGFGNNFADVKQQPNKQYKVGERVTVKFVGANPRNNRRLESTFLTVEFQEQSGANTVVYTDANWETQFHWESHGIGESTITILWDIPVGQKPGMYKITYNCDHKSIFSGVSSVTGSTEWFQVVASRAKLDKFQQKNKLLNKKKENEIKKGFKKTLSKLKSENVKGMNNLA
ncbi:uncharacterized protein LOC132714046 [Ruditapes philippinarum]|uniref:uncharacterized protein LOC132714046 n=1 Tax=Ruditapes philippinarum TaxID=129788 RepID=UPI00295B4E2E|nr:uncharacterized protein LOC132714046 [Ruditapes philippinarum]